MEITKKDVELAAKLAKMTVSSEEADIYQAQLEALFKWVRELSVLDTDGVKLTNVTLAAHTRADNPVENPVRAQALRADFADIENNQAKVKKVL